ncbi:hypothetical protein ECANGB1_2220 [Enterospora canceri]|uniref:Uncharacterized protein n=1 Tax=Enterospora canceri TaxID=1081671 RepID=A0A1Y1S8M3_9MICR|nr:hypothetical protein ECANGB1_2220 [Enterospora canceri]
MQSIEKLSKLIREVEDLLEQRQSQEKTALSGENKVEIVADLVNSFYRWFVAEKKRQEERFLECKKSLWNSIVQLEKNSLKEGKEKEATIKRFKDEVKELQESVDELTRDLEENNTDFETLRELVDNVTSENEAIKRENEQIKAKNSKLEGEIGGIEEKVVNLKQLLKEGSKKNLDEIMIKMKERDKEKEELTEEVKMIKEALGCMEEKADELEQLLEEAQGHAYEMEKENKKITQENSDNKNKAEKLIEENEKIGSVVKHLEEKLERVKKQINSKEVENKELSKANKELIKTKDELIDKQKASITNDEKTEALIESYRNQIARLKTSQEIRENESSQEICSLKENLTKKQGEIVALKEKELRNNFNTKLGELEKRLNENKKSIQEKDLEISEQKKLIESKRAENHRHNKVTNAYKQEIERLKDEMEKMRRSTVAPLEKEKGEQMREIDNLNEQIVRLVKELERLKNESVEIRNKSLDNLSNLQKLAKEKEDELNEKILRLEKETHEVEQYQKKTATYQKQVEDLRRENRALHAANRQNSLMSRETETDEQTSTSTKNMKYAHLFKNEEIFPADVTIYQETLSKIQQSLNDGTLECDHRFMRMIDKTIKRLEIYDDPALCKLAVQFTLCRRYVEDVIHAKELLAEMEQGNQSNLPE